MLGLLKNMFSRPQLAVQAFGLTDRGMVRKNNEDCFGIVEGANVFVVADGMGGHNGGEVASRAAVDTILSLLDAQAVSRMKGNQAAIRHAMVNGFETANRAVIDMAGSDPGLEGMGCTMVCALITGNSLHCCHVGDARCYLLHPDGRLEQVTTDHSSMVQAQAALADDETMPELPPRNVVTRVIGYPFPEPPEYHQVPLHPGSRVLLCSDGLWSMLDDNGMAAALGGSATPREACERLVAEGNRAGGTDNITALAVFLHQ